MCTLKILLSSLALASAHISMAPNHYAPSGWYFSTSIRIPHGHWNGSDHFYTSRVELTVPPGVKSVKPEPIPGWTVTMTDTALEKEDWYDSHSVTIKTRPDKIVWQADTAEDTLHNDNLMTIGLQIKMGCKFDTDYATKPIAPATTTRAVPQPYTTWWHVKQQSSEYGSLEIGHTSDWANQDWLDRTQDPSPYIYVCPGTMCKWDSDESGSHPPGGMMWHGTYVPTDKSCDFGGHDMYNQVMSMIEGEMSDIAALQNQAKDAHDDANQAIAIGIAGIALATAALGFLFSLCLFRITAKQSFAEIVSAVPLTSTYADKAGAANKA